MSEAIHLVSARSISKIPSFRPTKPRSHKLLSETFKTAATSRRNISTPFITKKSSRTSRPLVIIPTGGSESGKWACDYQLSLQDLQLEDLVEDDHQQNDAKVSINLCVQKHAGFGFSVDGRITTSFTRKCSNCFSSYAKEIGTNFNAWVLPSSRGSSTSQLPEISSDDPSVIYVNPGHQADLDSLIQDTIRLTTAAKDTCSDTCEKYELTLQYIGSKNAASTSKTWSRLLELRKTLL